MNVRSPASCTQRLIVELQANGACWGGGEGVSLCAGAGATLCDRQARGHSKCCAWRRIAAELWVMSTPVICIFL